MSRIVNTAKVLRRNWKKSTFFFGVMAYGVSYFSEKYRTHQMMQAYCEEARKYGEKPLSQLMKPKHVTVILNPEANYKKSNVQFEKFAAPLLHLAGFKVSVFQTEKEKQAQELMQVMSNTDAVIVAGGNGTLQEAVTGLLLRPNPEDDMLPLGIVPLGKTNTIAEYLFGSKSSSKAQLMAEAVMAVIRETTVKLDVLKVQYLDEDKPVFAMCNFEQGILADVDLLVQKYWYLGSLKESFTYFVNSLKKWQPIENKCLKYVAPCSGCSKCYVASKRKEAVELSRRWWHVFVPKAVDTKVNASADPEEDFSNRINEECGKHIELLPEYSTISISTTSTNQTEKSGSLLIKIFPKDLSMKQFISTGLSHRRCKQKDTTGIAQVINARELIIEVDSSHQTDSENTVLKEKSSHSALVVSASSNNIESPSLKNVVSANPTIIQSSISNNIEPSALNSVVSSNVIVIESTNSEMLSSDSVSDNNLDSEQSDNMHKEEVTQTTNTLDSVPQLDAPLTTIKSDSKEDNNQFSYIDNEKYKRASCKISVLPKQVTVFG